MHQRGACAVCKPNNGTRRQTLHFAQCTPVLQAHHAAEQGGTLGELDEGDGGLFGGLIGGFLWRLLRGPAGWIDRWTGFEFYLLGTGGVLG